MVVSLSSSTLSCLILDIGGYALMSICNRLKNTSQLATPVQHEKRIELVRTQLLFNDSICHICREFIYVYVLIIFAINRIAISLKLDMREYVY